MNNPDTADLLLPFAIALHRPAAGALAERSSNATDIAVRGRQGGRFLRVYHRQYSAPRYIFLGDPSPRRTESHRLP